MTIDIDRNAQPSAKRKFIPHLRWWMLSLFLLGVTVNYITRNSLGILAPELKSTFSMSTEQYSWVVASFQLAYTIFQPICGWLIDAIGLKLGFVVCAVIWSVMCLLHAGAASWVHLAILRFFMGASEAAATPANAKAIGDWFPKKERPIAAGWAGVGFSLGAMLAPPIIYLAHVSLGWQGAFLISGGIGLVWVALWTWLYHAPDIHPRLSPSEREHIQQDGEIVGQQMPFFKALKKIGRDKRFYGIALPAFMAEPAWAVMSFWVPLYLANERGMDLKQIVLFAWVPFLAADLGSIASGYLSRAYHRLFKCTRVNSIVASSITGAFLMFSLAVMTQVKDPYVAIALISVGGFGHQIISCMLSALVVETFDRDELATVNGMRGSCAWIASFIFSLIIGVSVDKIGFNPLFIAMGLFDFIGAIFMIMFIADRTKSKPESESKSKSKSEVAHPQ